MINLMLGDCLEAMKDIPDGSVDMVLCDLPYGTTQNKWDVLIPFEPMWKELNRIVRAGSAMVFTAAQPFTAALIHSNKKTFKYSMVWEKNKATGHLNANRAPLRSHEDILVFGGKRYFPQMSEGLAYSNSHKPNDAGDCYGKVGFSERRNITTRYPRSVVKFPVEMKPVHPTQKPVPLLEYLIKTYTLPGETVLDFTMGSGSTGVAAKNLGRSFIGIERDESYFEIAQKRIEATNASVGT